MATPDQSLSSGIISLVFVRAPPLMSDVTFQLLMVFLSPAMSSLVGFGFHEKEPLLALVKGGLFPTVSEQAVHR